MPLLFNYLHFDYRSLGLCCRLLLAKAHVMHARGKTCLCKVLCSYVKNNLLCNSVTTYII